MSVLWISIPAWLVALAGPVISGIAFFSGWGLAGIMAGQAIMLTGLLVVMSLGSRVQAEYRRRGWL